MRYPPQLLGEVVATLSSAQAAMAADPGVAGPAAVELASGALQAAAMGAAGAVRTEPVTPVDPKSAAKAFRCSCSWPISW